MIELVKKYKLFIIIGAVMLAALAVTFFLGGSPGEKNKTDSTKATVAATVYEADTTKSYHEDKESSTQSTTVKPKPKTEETTAAVRETSQSSKVDASEPSINSKSRQSSTSQARNKESSLTSKTETRTIRDKYKTDPVPEGKPEPVEPEEQTVADKKTEVTLSISCASVLNKLDRLDEDKLEVVPSDGWILKPVTVTINEGETVFDVTQRVCRDKKIHMEFSFTPVYNSAYIEGIGNLYEFDCGSGSGWMYEVDSWFPIYGCSRYVLKGGETINWKYTTNIGKDIGGGSQQWNED
jgi:hypothetical protein